MITPQQAQAKFNANRDIGLKVIMQRLENTFEEKAALCNLSICRKFDLTIGIDDIDLLRIPALEKACIDFEEKLMDAGWDLEVRMLSYPVPQDRSVTFVFTVWDEVEKQKKLAEKRAKQHPMDEMFETFMNSGGVKHHAADDLRK